MGNRVIAWDRDQTLGLFDRMGARMKGFDPKEIDEEHGESYLRHGLKPGIMELLGDLFREGYRHYIVTAGNPEWAPAKLRMSGLHPFFEQQFAGEEYLSTPGKFYRQVLQAAGVPVNEAPERLLVISDKLSDLPDDLLDVVFIEHDKSSFYHSDVLRYIIRELDRPEGGFIAGFNALYEEAISPTGNDFEEKYGIIRRVDKTLDIGNGVKITLGDRYNSMTEQQDGRYVGRVPTITEIEAPDYHRKVLEHMQTVTTIDQLAGYDRLETQAEALLSDRAKAQNIIRSLSKAIELVVEVEPPATLSVRKATGRGMDLELVAEEGIIFGVRNQPQFRAVVEAGAGSCMITVPLNWNPIYCRKDDYGYVVIACTG